MAALLLEAEITAISRNDTRFARSLCQVAEPPAPATLWAAGRTSILDDARTAFFCSSQCPGGVILKTLDAITAMRDECRTLIGGFHSPMEQECLGILLRGHQPVIWVPARSIHRMHLKPELQPAFEAGRLLILSAFGPKHERITAVLAEQRNRVVGALADQVFVAHAAPGSRTLALCRDLIAQGKRMQAINDPANQNLFDLGAVASRPESEAKTK